MFIYDVIKTKLMISRKKIDQSDQFEILFYLFLFRSNRSNLGILFFSVDKKMQNINKNLNTGMNNEFVFVFIFRISFFGTENKQTTTTMTNKTTTTTTEKIFKTHLIILPKKKKYQ